MNIQSLLFLFSLLTPALVVAQGLAESEPPQAAPRQAQEERLRIQSARAQVYAGAEQANAACYQKFAVNDCLRDVRAKNRLVLDALRRQEVMLNDRERQAKAIEALKNIEEKRLTGEKNLNKNPTGIPTRQ